MPNKGIIMLNGRQYGDTGTNYNVVKCTQQEYDAMTPKQKNNGCLYIVLGSTTNSVNYLGATVVGNTNQASGVSYDDSQTQLGASNVQDAIDRINADLSDISSDLAPVKYCLTGIRQIMLRIDGSNQIYFDIDTTSNDGLTLGFNTSGLTAWRRDNGVQTQIFSNH